MKRLAFFALAIAACGCASPALYRPSEQGDTGRVLALLDAGADPNEHGGAFANETALHIAAANNRLEVARLLLARGANPNAVASVSIPKTVFGTPLHFAACAGANAVVQLLLEKGADPEPGLGRCHGAPGFNPDPPLQPLALAELKGQNIAAELIRNAVKARLGLTAGGAKNAEAYAPLVGGLLKGYTGGGRTVAVAGFSYSDGHASSDGSVVAERLTTELIKQGNLKVVERREIEKVLGELKMQISGTMDQDSARRLGRLLGADLLVVGTLTELPGKVLEVNARLASVETGEAVSAASGRVEKDWLN